jgi:hypothetical protein
MTAYPMVGGFHSLNLRCLNSLVQEQLFPLVPKASSKGRQYEKKLYASVRCLSIYYFAGVLAK